MRSPSRRWLLAKDVHELLASRAYWLLLLAAGLLVGHAFLTAVEAYAEMSGFGGNSTALAQGLSPLDGLVVPTFGALSLAATFLLPFVVIRVVAHERQSGAWTLLVQGSLPLAELVTSKVMVALAGWLVSWLPAIAALVLWQVAGNHLGGGETYAVMLGHFLFAWITIGVAAAAAAVMDGEANAAIVALGFTVGGWALEFIGAARGGIFARLATFTPGAMLLSFEQGLIRSSAVAIAIITGLAGMLIAALWLAPGRTRPRRWLETAAVLGGALLFAVAAARLRPSWDASEDRRNSFPVADETALRRITVPLQLEIHLAPEDPRREEFQREALTKLQRLLPDLHVSYVARTGTGLLEQTDSLYGEIVYRLGHRSAENRSVNAAIVLDQLYELAEITPPPPSVLPYPGYPMRRRPWGIVPVYFAVWPLLLLGALLRTRRTQGERS